MNFKHINSINYDKNRLNIFEQQCKLVVTFEKDNFLLNFNCLVVTWTFSSLPSLECVVVNFTVSSY